MARRRHNSNTCFGCRLHALLVELYPGGPQNQRQLTEVLSTLASASADMLRCTDETGIKMFLMKIAMKTKENEEPTVH